MRSEEFDVNALAERLIPVLADAQSCRAYMYWRKTFGHIGNGQSNLYVYGEYETINDATLMLSLVALRKIDEFLSDETKKRSTDLRYSDFGICKEEVLIDRESIISRETRNKINKHITHLTDFGQPSIEAWENLDRVLEARANIEAVGDCDPTPPNLSDRSGRGKDESRSSYRTLLLRNPRNRADSERREARWGMLR